jgi:hypothetical protein
MKIQHGRLFFKSTPRNRFLTNAVEVAIQAGTASLLCNPYWGGVPPDEAFRQARLKHFQDGIVSDLIVSKIPSRIRDGLERAFIDEQYR